MQTLYLALETEITVPQIGGWASAEATRLAGAVTYDADHQYRGWEEGQGGELLGALSGAGLVVGYGVTSFDYRVLSHYGDTAALPEHTFDIRRHIVAQHGHCPSLAALAQLNLRHHQERRQPLPPLSPISGPNQAKLIRSCQRRARTIRLLYELWEAATILWLPDDRIAVWPDVPFAPLTWG